MGKINDALKKAQKENIKVVKSSDGSLKQNRTELNKVQEKSQSENKIQSIQVLGSRKESDLEVKRIFNLNKNLITLLKPQSIEAEMFKILRSNILFPATGEAPRSILITSALPGDGKSFVATNLAVSIAQNINEHVLLMDCDMRKPSVHTQFGYEENIPGLREYLTSGVSLSSLLLKTSVEKLTILPGGEPPHNPSELLSSKEMLALITEVKKRYEDRYTILDSPPPQLTAETNALARRVDGIILVISCRTTPRELIAEVIENFGKEKIIGIVFNRFEIYPSKYYGYRKYGKYGRYGRYFKE